MAAACAVASFSSMEAEVSIISTMEMGRFSWVKRLSSWRMPSSNTAKSRWPRSVTKLFRASVTDRLRLMISMPGAEDRGLRPGLGAKRRRRGGGGEGSRATRSGALRVHRSGPVAAQGSPEEASRAEAIGRKTSVPGRATLSSSLRFLRSGRVA